MPSDCSLLKVDSRPLHCVDCVSATHMWGGATSADESRLMSDDCVSATVVQEKPLGFD